MRYPVIDGFRGFFLIFMMIHHVDRRIYVGDNANPGTLIGKMNHHTFGFVEDAQGFIFISGIVIGMVYGKILLKKGFEACNRAVFKRISVIFTYVVALIIFSTVTANLLIQADMLPQFLDNHARAPVLHPLSAVFLISAVDYVDILNLYIWMMIFTPLVLWLLFRGQALAVFAGSFMIWTVTQLGLTADLFAALTDYLLANGIDITLRSAFYVTGWQIVYVMGLYLGFQYAQGRIDLDRLREPQWRGLFHVALAASAFFLVLKFVVVFRLLGDDISRSLIIQFNRPEFSVGHLFNFLAHLVVVVWLINVGRHAPFWLWRNAGWLITRVMTIPALVFIGQHSLFVFSAHVVIVYAVLIATEGRSLTPLVASAIVVLSPVLLYGAALMHKHMQDRRKRLAPQK